MLNTASKNIFSKMLKHNFFFFLIYSKIEFFHCQSVNSQLQQVTANNPQSVFFTAEHPDSWISIT